MKIKYIIIFLLVIISIGFVSAADECNQTMTNLTDGNACDISVANTRLILAPNSYYLNGSTASIAGINVKANNVIVDCNNSLLIGNGSNPLIRNGGFRNNTIKNCHLYYGYYGISMIDAHNSSVTNNTLNSSTQDGINYIRSNNGIVDNNTLFNGEFNGIQIDRSNDTIVRNNVIYNYSIRHLDGTSSRGMRIIDSMRINVTDNLINDSRNYGIFNYASNNSYLARNRIYNVTYNAIYSTRGDNTLIDGNIITLADIGIYGDLYSENLTVINNVLSNITLLSDGYSTSMYIDGTINAFVNNTSVINGGQMGILVRGANDTTILNTSCEFMTLAEEITIGKHNHFEPRVCIGVLQEYKTFTGGSHNFIGNPFQNASSLGVVRSHNITILGVTTDEEAQVILRTQGTTNLTTDISGYWNVSFKVGNGTDFFTDLDTFYIQNDVAILTNVNKTLVNNTYMGLGNGDANNVMMLYQLQRGSIRFINVNSTFTIIPQVFNRVDSLVYVSNGTLPCGSTLVNGNCNISTPPKNITCVSDNFYLTTENGGAFCNPFAITQSSKSIGVYSPLSGTLTIPFNSSNSIQCSDIRSITLNSNSQSYACDEDTNLLTFSSIAFISGTNTLLLVTGVEGSGDLCEGFSNGVKGLGYIFTFIFAVIGIIGVAGIVAYYYGAFDGFSMSGLGDMGYIEWDNLIYIVMGIAGFLIVLIAALIMIWVPCSITV